MKKEEKQVFRQLCSFKTERFNKELLQYATPEVLGHLFFNRMQGVAYGNLIKHDCIGAVNREFQTSLRNAYEQNIQKNNSFFRCVNLLSDILCKQHGKYAMLKGAILCRAYPEGYRTSNDIDLLVRPKDVTVIGEALTNAGFRQGSIRGGEFVPAGRKEIIESKMLRGETVPYIFEIGLPHMRFLEVDINFSLDYKNGGTDVLESMLSDSISYGNIATLNRNDFLIHLCCHLCKEATTLPWVKMKRDMTLYKYADIYMLLDNMSEVDVSDLFVRARELELEKICAFAVLQTSELFESKSFTAEKTAGNILQSDPDFLHRVISPVEKKIYIYKTKDITERFFMNDRAADLEEVTAQ